MLSAAVVIGALRVNKPLRAYLLLVLIWKIWTSFVLNIHHNIVSFKHRTQDFVSFEHPSHDTVSFEHPVRKLWPDYCRSPAGHWQEFRFPAGILQYVENDENSTLKFGEDYSRKIEKKSCQEIGQENRAEKWFCNIIILAVTLHLHSES